jgi:hypothetical protein
MNEDVFQSFGTATLVVRGNDLDAAARSLRGLLLSRDSEMRPQSVRPAPSLTHKPSSPSAGIPAPSV